MLKNVSTKTLAKIAVYGAIGLSTTGMVLQWKTKDNIKKSEFYQEALNILRNSEQAKILLGEPIRDGNFKLDSRINAYSDKKAQFQIPVKGPKERGTLYFWAQKPSTYEKWNVHRMELELKSDSTKRLLIKDEIVE